VTDLIEKTRYEKTVKGIFDVLGTVEGIGQVFDHERYVTDWEQFFSLYVTDQQTFCLAWFGMTSTVERSTGIGEADASDQLNWIEKTERWRLQIFHGMKDDENEPSDRNFELLMERTEEALRFNQNLGGVVYKIRLAGRPFNGAWTLGGVLCHRGELTLEVTHRIMNPN
jgi:hypothetical protein